LIILLYVITNNLLSFFNDLESLIDIFIMKYVCVGERETERERER